MTYTQIQIDPNGKRTVTTRQGIPPDCDYHARKLIRKNILQAVICERWNFNNEETVK